MSALGLDDRKNPGGVLHYAPRRQRPVDDESTIRPVLERLSRGEGRTPPPRMARRSGGVAAMPSVDFEAAAKNSLPIAARLAVAGGLVALMAALGAGIFIWPRTADHTVAATSSAAPSAATALPTPVHTVTIRPADKAGDESSLSMTDKDPARAPQTAPIVSADVGAGAEAARAVMPAGPAASADPATSPIKLWSMMPGDTSPTGWTPAGQQAMDQAASADTTSASPPQADTPPHKSATTRHVRHALRHERKWHRRRHAAAAPAPAPAEAQGQQAAQADQPQAQQIKKLPLQAAIDRIFSNTGATGNGAAAATTP